jgi:dienelactone hydrolase
VVTARDVEYSAGGKTMRGRLALPDGEDQRPGVLIAHEANGLDDHQRSRPEQFARLGYVAFALDYHGGGTVYTDPEAMMARIGEIGSDVEQVRALAAAGLDVLLGEPRVDPAKVAAIGYCFGGLMALELGRSGADVKAIVGIHPGLASARPDDSTRIRGKVLICVGADDFVAPPDVRAAFEEEMRVAGVDSQMHVYGGVKHSFTHPNVKQSGMPGLEYNAAADRRAWTAMLNLFGEVFV